MQKLIGGIGAFSINAVCFLLKIGPLSIGHKKMPLNVIQRHFLV
jgi:hypothetical protein